MVSKTVVTSSMLLSGKARQVHYNQQVVFKLNQLQQLQVVAHMVQIQMEGVGKESTIKIDGDFSDWSDSMLIAQGVANDSCTAFNGGHENCVLDSYSLYASWDNDNLYLDGKW